MSTKKEATFSRKFKYSEEQSEYEFQLKKKRNWWWLLLLLLPLLLLIRCSHDLTVTTIDAVTSLPIEGVNVALDYDSHILLCDSMLVSDQHHHIEQVTDSAGQTVFHDLKCSIYSYVFYCTSKATISCAKDCYQKVQDEKNFHFTRHVTEPMPALDEKLLTKVVDLESGEPLPDAIVYYTHTDASGASCVDSMRTNAYGLVKLPGYNRCTVFDKIAASCYGYADTSKVNVQGFELLAESSESTLRMRPQKERFTFFIYNVETREPIPGALAEVTLTDPRSKVIHARSVTNVDGKGVGVYNDAFILSKIDIKGSKPHFVDSTLVGDYTVEQFIKLPEEKRTVWLRPEPFVVEYTVIDSLTSQPIAGVENEITVTDPTGRTETYVEISNRNGKFPVKAKEGSIVEIISHMDPDYKDKVTRDTDFGDAEVIALQPNLMELTFRTLDAETGDLLPNCELYINASKSHVSMPKNSGGGVFTVSGLYPSDLLTIIASQTSFKTNDTKISDSPVMHLSVSAQAARDIPLYMDLPPCSGGNEFKRESSSTPTSVIAYSMGKRSGTFEFEIDAYSIPDDFVVYDGPNDSFPKLLEVTVKDKQTFRVHFTRGAVTIKAVTSESGSSWRYTPHCPE